MNVYQVTKEAVDMNGFKLDPIDRFNSTDKKQVALPPKSITNISSYLLSHNENGIVISE
jgi:hypothetical protein